MWHAMPNMESLLNYNSVNLLWTYQRTKSSLRTNLLLSVIDDLKIHGIYQQLLIQGC